MDNHIFGLPASPLLICSRFMPAGVVVDAGFYKDFFMKYSMLCCAVGVAFLSNAAIASPKISGEIQLEALQQSTDVVSRSLNSGRVTYPEDLYKRPTLEGAGEIKFSASQKLNDDLTTRYSLTYLVGVADDGRTNFRSGTTYISLDHKDYGRLRFGRMTTPEDELVDVGVARSGWLYGVGKPFTNSGFKTNNTVQYYSPYFMESKDGRTRVKLHYAMDEKNSSVTGLRLYKDDGSNVRENKKRDVFVAQILHSGKIDWGFAYTQAGSDLKAISGMARYNADDWSAALAVRQADYGTGKDETGAFGSLIYSLQRDWAVYGQAGYVKNYAGQGFNIKDTDYLVGALGVSKDFRLASGRATVYAETALEKIDFIAPNSSETRLSSDRKEEVLGFATGIEFKF